MDLHLKLRSTKLAFFNDSGIGTFTAFTIFSLMLPLWGPWQQPLLSSLMRLSFFCSLGSPDHLLSLSFPNFRFLIPLDHYIHKRCISDGPPEFGCAVGSFLLNFVWLFFFGVFFCGRQSSLFVKNSFPSVLVLCHPCLGYILYLLKLYSSIFMAKAVTAEKEKRKKGKHIMGQRERISINLHLSSWWRRQE